MGQHTNSPGAPKHVKARDREDKAIALRMAGATYRQIGQELGYSAQAAWGSVDRALRRIAKHTNEDAKKLRRIELRRLERLHLLMWQEATKKETKEKQRLAAIDRCLKIAERRARLMGLDKPQMVDVTSGGKSLALELLKPSEIAGRVAALLAATPELGADDDEAAGDNETTSV